MVDLLWMGEIGWHIGVILSVSIACACEEYRPAIEEGSSEKLRIRSSDGVLGLSEAGEKSFSSPV